MQEGKCFEKKLEDDSIIKDGKERGFGDHSSVAGLVFDCKGVQDIVKIQLPMLLEIFI